MGELVGGPRRRLLPRSEVPGRPARAARAPRLVQVGGVHDLALGLRAALHRLLLERPRLSDRPQRRRSDGARGDRDLASALLVAAWLVYDVLCRALGRWPKLLALALFGFIALSAYAAGRLFSPRAMFIEVGSMIGTMMVGNVLFVIIPGHWELIRAKRAGREPDPAPGIKGKLRSVHNNYLTLPVVLTMLSNHFPFVYGHDHAWLVLCAFVALGAYVRHFFNLRHAGRTRWSMPVVAARGRARAGDLAVAARRVVRARERGERRGREADLPDAPLRELPHAARRARDRGHRAEPRRREALAGARDQPRDERPGRHAVVREQALARSRSSRSPTTCRASPARSRSADERARRPQNRVACARCSRAMSSSSARTRCPPRTTGTPPT